MTKMLRRGSRGIIIVVVLLVLAALVALASGMVIAGSGNLNGSFESVESEKALWTAQAGIAEGLVRLSSDNSWAGMTSTIASTSNTFQVTTYRNPEVTPRGVTVPPGTIYIHSRGQTRTGKAREAGLLVKTGYGAMSYAILAKQNIEIDGGTVEIRDPLTDLPLPGPADLGSVNGNIELKGSSTVNGNADLSDSATLTGLGMLTGIRRTMSPPTFPDVVLPPGPNPETQPDAAYSGGLHTLDPGFYNKLEIDNGAEVTFSPGNYVVKELIVKNNSKLVFHDTTPCNIFATGKVEMEKYNIVNTSRDPKNFRILADETNNPDVNVKEGSTGYYVVYAPESTVLVDNGSTIYGVVVGRDITVKNSSNVYYDPNSASALDMGGGSTTAGLQKVSHQVF